jgi:hypothetical protein
MPVINSNMEEIQLGDVIMKMSPRRVTIFQAIEFNNDEKYIKVIPGSLYLADLGIHAGLVPSTLSTVENTHCMIVQRWNSDLNKLDTFGWSKAIGIEKWVINYFQLKSV